MESAKIFGDDSIFYGILFAQVLDANVIAVDDVLAPAFQKENRNLFGIRTLPNLQSYGLEVSSGEHNLTILVERIVAFGQYESNVYYIGECNLSFLPDRNYLITTKILSQWHGLLEVHILDKHEDEVTKICNMESASLESIFEIIDEMKADE